MKLTESYHDDLVARLRKDRAFAVAYLNECLKNPDQGAFLLGLRNVVEAYGFKKLAGKTEISREHLFRMLSRTGNPRFVNLRSVANALGFGLAVTDKPNFGKAA
jgi:probable addiction module antidote protein